MVRLLSEQYSNLYVSDYDSETEIDKDNDFIVTHSPVEIADACDTVLVYFHNPVDLTDAVLGNNGLIKGKKLKTCINLSTTDVKTSTSISSRLSGVNVDFLDSPVKWKESDLEAGTMTAMVSGSKSVFEQFFPVLRTFCKNVFYIDEEAGHAQIVKALHNLMAATSMAITSEAVILGVKAGIDPKRLLNVFIESPGAHLGNVVDSKFPNEILTRNFNWGATINIYNDDVKRAVDYADEAGIDLKLGKAVRELYATVLSHGYMDQDITRLACYYEQMAGAKILPR